MAKPAPDGPVIEAEGLRKSFHGLRGGRRLAVDGLDLVVPRGGVHGFLGPNGSGKTTTIRMLLGLVHADAGTMRLMGRPVPAALPQVIGTVDAVVEAPRFFPNFSGRRNLRLLARVAGVRRGRVDEVLDVVGLRERSGDRYKAYSHGMEQRLAIAATLLKNPKLLILDEPTNGLDPAGIREVRDTLRRLGATGEVLLRGFWRGSPAWLLSTNVAAWLLHGADVPVSQACPSPGTGCPLTVVHLSMMRGATLLCALTALLLAAFTIGFRRRDVT